MGREEQLAKTIEKHNKHYWEEQNPQINDEEYDKLKRELEQVNPNHPSLHQIEIDKVEGSGKIRHRKKMESLNKVYNIEDLIKWAESVARNEEEKFAVQWKYDGCSAGYDRLTETLVTRGDGEIGENISDKLVLINFHQAIENNNEKYIRGELLITDVEFERMKNSIFRKDGSQYKNSRNFVAGMLNKKETDTKYGKFLTLVPFYAENRGYWSLKYLKKNKIIETMSDLVDKIDYPTDGIVLKLVDEEYMRSLGSTSHHPRGAIALKFANPSGESRLLSIEWSMGKRKLTPIGKIDPVEISGVIVKNVNFHNAKYIKDRDIQIEDEVIVERCGDVIPDLVSNTHTNKSTKKGLFPEKCPICKSDLKYMEPELYCINFACTGKRLKQLSDSVVRIGIENLGEPTLTKMMQHKNVRNLVDIFNLTLTDVMELPGFATVSARNLFEDIKKVRVGGAYEWQILASLNIHGVGRSLSRKLLAKRTLDELRNMSESDISNMENVGPIRAHEIDSGICEKYGEQSEYLDELLNILPIREDSSKMSKTICFTGNRPENYRLLSESHGFEVKSSIVKGLDYLVCHNPNSGSNKLTKARKAGVKVISHEEFFDLVEGG